MKFFIKVNLALLIYFVFINVALSQEVVITNLDAKANNSNITNSLEENEKYFTSVISNKLSTNRDKGAAFSNLGLLYMLKGKFTKADNYLKESIKYPQNPVISTSYFNLGMLYIHGKGEIIKDNYKAFHWFVKSSKLGNIQASDELLVMCHNKEVSEQGLHKFTQWTIDAIYDKGMSDSSRDIAIYLYRKILTCPSEYKYVAKFIEKKKANRKPNFSNIIGDAITIISSDNVKINGQGFDKIGGNSIKVINSTRVTANGNKFTNQGSHPIDVSKSDDISINGNLYIEGGK